MLDIDNLSVHLGGKHIIKDVNLRIKQGEWWSVFGPSGSGKSTFLNALMGFVSPSAGSIAFNQHLLSNKGKVLVPPAERIFGFVPQDGIIFPHLSIMENLTIGLNHLPKKQRLNEGREMLERLGLGGRGNENISHLSGGEQQRVTVGRALLIKPRILLLDEPFNHLDRIVREKLWLLVKDLCVCDLVTVIHVTHDPDEAFQLADEMVILVNGVLSRHGKPQEIFNRPQSVTVARLLGPINCIPIHVWENEWQGQVVSHDVLLRPHQMIIKEQKDESILCIRGTINGMLFKGPWLEWQVQAGKHTYLVAGVNDQKWEMGAEVWVCTGTNPVASV
ncbi:MAG: hypothetical protein CMP10_09780 [Zetaproteobacteria bacterium]|nr:hypothetical protein [Pseudobdellovibrionaceae bacterium]